MKVALRPEYLFLKPAPDGDDGAEVRGQVKTSAYLGGRSHIYVNIEDLEAPISVGTMNVPDSFRPGGGGAEVWLSWAPGSVVLLRPD